MASDADVQKELTCPMCTEMLHVPKLLTCMHTFCEACIKPLIAYDTGELTCPLCRHVTLAKNGTKSISTNFIAQNIIDAFEAITLKSEGILVCSECDQDEAKMFCCDCYSRLCLICSEHHKRSLKFKDHSVLDFDGISRSQMSQGRIKKCSEHREVLKYFCNDCHHTICQDCSASKKHSGHKLQLLQEIATENKEELENLIKGAAKKKKAMEKSIAGAESIMQNVRKTKEYSVFVIEEAFGKINELLTMKKKRLIKILESKLEEGVDSIATAKETTRILDEWIQFAHTVIESKCEAEIMDVFTNLKRQLEEISAMTYMKPKSLEELEEIRSVPNIKQNPNAKSKPRITNITQILGLQSSTPKVNREPFSSHSSLTSRGSQMSITDTNSSKLNAPQCKDTSTISENAKKSQTHAINTNINDQEKGKTRYDSMKKIIPFEMTPDLDVAKQVKYEKWDFHKATANKGESEKMEKRKPPPRPPPAKIHIKKTWSDSMNKPTTQVSQQENSAVDKQVKQRRQTVASRPTEAPPPPPIENRSFQRTMSQPTLDLANLREPKKPALPPPPPPQGLDAKRKRPPPSPLPGAVSVLPVNLGALNEIQFPVPPSVTPSECSSTQASEDGDSESQFLIVPHDNEQISDGGEKTTDGDEKISDAGEEASDNDVPIIEIDEEAESESGNEETMGTDDVTQDNEETPNSHMKESVNTFHKNLDTSDNEEWKEEIKSIQEDVQNDVASITASEHEDEASSDHDGLNTEDIHDSDQENNEKASETELVISMLNSAQQEKNIATVEIVHTIKTSEVDEVHEAENSESLEDDQNVNIEEFSLKDSDVAMENDFQQTEVNNINGTLKQTGDTTSSPVPFKTEIIPGNEVALESDSKHHEINNNETSEHVDQATSVPVPIKAKRPSRNGTREQKASNSESTENVQIEQTTEKHKQPQAPPRFYAGITMTKQEIIVNQDVLSLIIEAINDACLLTSDQGSDVAQSDAMFSTKESVIKQ